MFGKKKRKAEEAKRQKKQLVQTALVAGGATAVAFAVINTVEYLAFRKVREEEAALRDALTDTVKANRREIQQIQEEVAANAAASHEALSGAVARSYPYS